MMRVIKNFGSGLFHYIYIIVMIHSYFLLYHYNDTPPKQIAYAIFSPLIYALLSYFLLFLCIFYAYFAYFLCIFNIFHSLRSSSITNYHSVITLQTFSQTVPFCPIISPISNSNPFRLFFLRGHCVFTSISYHICKIIYAR